MEIHFKFTYSIIESPDVKMMYGVFLGRKRSIDGLHGSGVSTGKRALGTDFRLC
jgi:hypothetical protein